MQYEENGGLCGVCGDAWNAPVREHEAGGKYATGIITRHYRTNQTIPVTAQITANHLGYIEFRLCPNNDVTTAVTHACLDQYLLGRHHSRYNIMRTILVLHSVVLNGCVHWSIATSWDVCDCAT